MPRSPAEKEAGRGRPSRRRARAKRSRAGAQGALLMRFQDMLHHRVRALNDAFNRAIAENKFRGVYRGVFPIKVNQLREVVEEILDAGRPYHYGIEVGSKPELYAGPQRAHGQRVAHRLQRLQGRPLHPHGAARAEARQEGDPHRREAQRGARDHPHREGAQRRADDRPARAPRDEGRRQVGDERRRAREVRPLHGRDARGSRDIMRRRA
jgi:hypothetical protein